MAGRRAYHFEFGRDATYGHSTLPQSAGAGTADVAVHAPIGELIPGTTYHFRVVAIAGATNPPGAESRGDGRSMVRGGSNLHHDGRGAGAAHGDHGRGDADHDHSAIANGVVNPNGTPTSYRVEYGLDTTYGFIESDTAAGQRDERHSRQCGVVGPEAGDDLSFPGGGDSGTSLNSTAAARAPIDGADQTFTTLELPIGVFVSAATGVTTTGATLNGGAYPNGNVTVTVHFEYGTDTDLRHVDAGSGPHGHRHWTTVSRSRCG